MTDTAHVQTDPAPVRWMAGAAELTYTDTGGSGEPLLLIHAGVFADWFTPMAALPALRDHRVIHPVRAGYTGAPTPPGLTVADLAGHAAALLHHLEAGPAHVVAHSSGTAIALQLALDHPALVRTLCLSEPPLVPALADPADLEMLGAALGSVIGAAVAAAARGDLPAAFDTFMAAVCGPGYRDVLIDTLGSAGLAEAESRCGYFFAEEIRAVEAWTFDPAAAAHLRPPVLLIEGSTSPPPVHRLIARLAGLLPHATTATIQNANHLLPLTAPTELGRLITEFCQASR